MADLADLCFVLFVAGGLLAGAARVVQAVRPARVYEVPDDHLPWAVEVEPIARRAAGPRPAASGRPPSRRW